VTGHVRRGSARTGRLGLCTDLYELRMVESYLRRGMTADATFSLFARPSVHRPWYVALGVGRVLELLEHVTFGPEELAYLEEVGIGEQARAWLADLEVTGEVVAVDDGTLVLATEPVLEVTAPLPIAQLLETAVVNLVQYPTLVATKAARCALVANGRRLVDFGFRRAHGLETGVEAAWAAYVGGGFATSNVEAGRRHGVPVMGTMAHSYVQAFPDEHAAFTAFVEDQPRFRTLLVDTYDTLDGVRQVIDVAHDLGVTPDAVRLDSGDLASLSVAARALLDEAGLGDTAVFASGGLDEYRIHDLVAGGAPIDGFGVGTALTVSQDHPGMDIVYKLVAYDGRPVAKYSGGKATLPGPKQVHRRGTVAADVLTCRGDPGEGHVLLHEVWRDGEVAAAPTDLPALREHVTAELERLPARWRRPPYPDVAPTPAVSPALHQLDDRVRDAAFDPDHALRSRSSGA
jgi:nicotinate phosphoribosyltransferase